MEKMDGPITKFEASYEGKADASRKATLNAFKNASRQSRSRSPPKASVLSTLSATLKEAAEAGVVVTLIKQAEECIATAEAMREAARQAKRAAESGPTGENGGRGRSPRRKSVGDKDPSDEMAKMQRKLEKKMKR